MDEHDGNPLAQRELCGVAEACQDLVADPDLLLAAPKLAERDRLVREECGDDPIPATAKGKATVVELERLGAPSDLDERIPSI